MQPGVVSITQSTELGTLYTLEEMRALAEHAHAHGMLLHVDGSRLANAAAALDVGAAARSRPAPAPTSSASAGRRSGCSRPRLVVILDPSLAAALPYLRKQSMQLASKMRFVSAQLEALLTGDLWRRAAATPTRWRGGSRTPSRAT